MFNKDIRCIISITHLLIFIIFTTRRNIVIDIWTAAEMKSS